MKHPLHKLTSIVAILFLFSLSAFADNDVTSTYLTNADFETSVTGDALDNTIYDVAGWTEYKTPQTISYYKLGSVLYGAATAGLGTVPANGSSVTTGNTALLGMKLHWYQNDSICVSQTATNLPAGTYKLTWDSYMAEVNAFVAANQSSRCGVQIDGTVFYTALPTAKTTWTNNSVTFTITSTKNVNVRMGYKKNANMGGNDSPILFIDNVKLIQITTPTLNSDISTLEFIPLAKSKNFNLLGTNLTNDITLTVPTGLTLNGTNVTGGSGTYTITLANSNQSNSITATWDGTTLVNGTITAASGAVSTPINVKSDDITCFTPLYNSPIVNIITDPNMNDLANFAGWGTKSAQSTYTYCGLRSVKVTGKCGGSLDYGLNGKIKANTEYRVKAMISTNGTGEAKIGLSGVATSNVLQTISTAASEWKALDFKFTTGSTISSPNMYFNSCESQTATEGYIDNWEMYAVPKVYASPASLTIYSVGSSKKTAIRAENIFSDINITSPTGFTVSPTTMASTVSGSTADSLTVTFNGAGSSNGYVYFTSGSVKDSLYVSGVAEPALASSVGYLSMDELNTTGSFILTAANLVSDVTLTAPDGVSLNEYSIPAAIANGQTIDVLYNGKANSTGYITLTSGTASTRVRVLARRNDENYTPTYSTLTNLIGDAYINNAANFSGWGNKGINTDSMYVYSGSKSGSFYGGGQCPGSFDKVLTGTLKNSTTYLMKAKVYAIGGGVHLGFYNSGASDIVSPTISTTDSWQDAELKFTTPAALSTNYGVFFNSCWTGANNGYIDNWELYELPTINVSGNNATLDSLIYTTPGTSFDLPISASGFTNNLIVSSDNPNFVPTPATLPSTGGTVSVLFVGTVSDAGTLTISAANNASPAPGMQRISFSGTTITVPMKATVLITGVNLPKVESFSLLSANNILSAKFNLLKNADVEFGVYTTNGMLITNYKQSFQSGSHQKDLVSNLQKGIYLVKITIDGQSITKKITN